MGVLRMLLALLVANSHHEYFSFESMAGHTAVQAFFVISGFYIALILDEKYKRGVWTFYSNRFLRIYPPYYVAMLLMLASLLLLDAHPFGMREDFFEAFARSWRVWAAYVWTNLALAGQELFFVMGWDAGGSLHFEISDMDLDPAWQFSLVTQAWSLGVEVAFYLAAPYILRGGPKRLAYCFAGSLGLHLLMNFLGSQYAEIGERLTPCELYLFLSGSLGFHLYKRLGRRALPAWLGPTCLAAMLLYVLSYEAIPESIGFPLLIAVVALGAPFVFRAFRNSRWDRFVGDLSYPFYLTHFFAIGVFETYFDEVPSLLLLLCQLALAVGLYAAVDRPLDRWRQRRADRQTVIRPQPGQPAGVAPLAPVPTGRNP
jgi:peptidoglycan/LPS O-acetylase OafA/YrhL